MKKYFLVLPLLLSLVLLAAAVERPKKQECWVKMLNYHEIIPEAEIKSPEYLRLGDKQKAGRAIYLIVPLEKFEEQLQFLKSTYTVMSFSSMLRHVDSKEPFDSNGVVITFDGSGNFVYRNVYPLLKKYDLPAIVFIQTKTLNDKKALTWDQIKEMSNNGIEIGSHSINHYHMSKKNENETTEMYEQRLRNELAGSKQFLESKLKKKVEYFAYPYGSYNETVERLAEEAGYKAAVTVQWDKNTLSTNKFRLKRRPVKGTMSLPEFVDIFRFDSPDDYRESAE